MEKQEPSILIQATIGNIKRDITKGDKNENQNSAYRRNNSDITFNYTMLG